MYLHTLRSFEAQRSDPASLSQHSPLVRIASRLVKPLVTSSDWLGWKIKRKPTQVKFTIASSLWSYGNRDTEILYAQILQELIDKMISDVVASADGRVRTATNLSQTLSAHRPIYLLPDMSTPCINIRGESHELGRASSVGDHSGSSSPRALLQRDLGASMLWNCPLYIHHGLQSITLGVYRYKSDSNRELRCQGLGGLVQRTTAHGAGSTMIQLSTFFSPKHD